MARIWTSPNSCEYVPEDVYITVKFEQPVPEPDIDKIFKEFNETCRDYTLELDGVGGPRANIKEDFTTEDNPTIIIDGLMYVTYTGEVEIYNYVADGNAEDFIDEIEAILKNAGYGRITDFERHASY